MVVRATADYLRSDGAEVEIGQTLGGGTFGSVHSGTWCNMPVAVKRTLQRQFISRSDLHYLYDRLCMEVHALRFIHHPNVVSVTGVVIRNLRSKAALPFVEVQRALRRSLEVPTSEVRPWLWGVDAHD